ncbi:MAG: penicillin-binding protein activator LpoB [Desulfobulbaceae bacterium]|nr:MAG: penicillin-binding protein activator LpoB [Desulfobulbaceae bacterium]
MKADTMTDWKKKLTGICVACALLLALAGCTSWAPPNDYTNMNMDFSSIQTVAVLPFQNLTSDEQAGERVRDSFMGMLLATEAFYVLPPGEVARGINRAGVRTAHAPTADEIKSMGKILEAEAVITGVLREYGPVRSGSTEANIASVSLSLIETQTGTIVWAASSTRGGIDLKDRMLGGGGKPMNKVTEQVINDLLDQLFE